MTLEQHRIEAILARQTFAASCVNMGWRWVYTPFYDADGNYLGLFLQSTFTRPDTVTGVIGEGLGREWPIFKGASENGIVKTAWLAVNQIVTHEMMEAFKFDDVRVFDPHASVADLVAMNRLAEETRP